MFLSYFFDFFLFLPFFLYVSFYFIVFAHFIFIIFQSILRLTALTPETSADVPGISWRPWRPFLFIHERLFPAFFWKIDTEWTLKQQKMTPITEMIVATNEQCKIITGYRELVIQMTFSGTRLNFLWDKGLFLGHPICSNLYEVSFLTPKIKTWTCDI